MRVFAAFLLLIASAVAPAADPPAVPRSVLDKLIADSLRDVHNKGAELFNTGNPLDCYRMLQGCLLGTRPLLGHRPDVQKLIDDGLADADRNPSMSKRAFMLHELVVKTRVALRGDDKPEPPAAKGTGVERLSKMPSEIVPETKVPPVPKKEPPTPPTPPKSVAVEGSTITGKLTAGGKPIAGAAVLFVQRDVPAPRVGDTVTDADGKFTVRGLPPGTYSILVATTPATPKEVAKTIDAKYELVPTSPLRAKFNNEPEVMMDLNLQ